LLGSTIVFCMITRNNTNGLLKTSLRIEENLLKRLSLKERISSENLLGQKLVKLKMQEQKAAASPRHPNLVKSNDNVTDTEVGALLSADMRDEAYYTQKLHETEAMKSPRYRGFVEHDMEHQRNPRVGPIGVPDVQAQRKLQSLTRGRPVRPKNEETIANKDELLYLGEESKVQKPQSHANQARQRVQQKTSTELLKMEKDHTAVKTYLDNYEREKTFKHQQNLAEKKRDMEMLKSYNPFGKPGGGAPMKTTSGRDLPKMSNDFEIRFRDDAYHKKMVDSKRYKNDGEVQHEYKDELDLQLQEKAQQKQQYKSRERSEEMVAAQYDPYGKPGGGAPRRQDTRAHWSKLEPGASVTSVDSKRKRLQLQQQDNIRKAEDIRNHRRMRQLKEDPVYNPWGKGSGNPRFDDRGNVSVRFGMKTHYDVFNDQKIVATHSGATLGGWPLPTADSTAVGDAGLHSANDYPGGHEAKRRGLLSKRHGATFVTEPGETRPPLLNGKEAGITDAGSKPKPDSILRRQGALSKLHNQALVGPLHKTDHETKVQKPSAGTLKRELENDNRILNLKVNAGHQELKSPRGTSAQSGDKASGGTAVKQSSSTATNIEKKNSVQFDVKANKEYSQMPDIK